MILDHRGNPMPKRGLGFVPPPPATPKPQVKSYGATADAIGFLIWPVDAADLEAEA